MRIIIAGGRDFNDYELLKDEVFKIFRQFVTEGLIPDSIGHTGKHIEIVCGKASGADTLGEIFAKEYLLPVKYFPADWDNLTPSSLCKIKYNKYGKPYNILAGINRNLDMALYAKEDNGVLLAFWDKRSTGTRNMINLAKDNGLKVFVINY